MDNGLHKVKDDMISHHIMKEWIYKPDYNRNPHHKG